ncbi:reverse transcriptase domain-containing protein, partial [Vibrio parahaemolyticus]|uniref:reverse transcriptase domain-containing protein n=1 Tax=Vibrio parahaemolyticus TaxID=670 RepID=UPI00301D7A03
QETFAPVIRHSSLRTLFALAAEMDLKMKHLDVDTAFLNGDLDEEVFMEQPLGFTKKNKESKVCLLKKSLYGLKQAPRA